MLAGLPPPELNDGTITSGLCDSPEAQAAFDAEQAGRAPTGG